MLSNWHLHLSYNMLYLVVLAVILVAGREWLVEHDARLRAEQFSEDAKQMIADWKTAQQQRTATADKQVAVVRQQQAAAQQTPQQAVAALSQLVPLPKPIEQPKPEVTSVLPPNTMLLPMEDIVPLMNNAAEGKVCSIRLDECTANLADEKRVSGKLEDENKKWAKAAGHHGFFGKLWSGSKKVGVVLVAIGAGYLAGHH